MATKKKDIIPENEVQESGQTAPKRRKAAAKTPADAKTKTAARKSTKKAKTGDAAAETSPIAAVSVKKANRKLPASAQTGKSAAETPAGTKRSRAAATSRKTSTKAASAKASETAKTVKNAKTAKKTARTSARSAAVPGKNLVIVESPTKAKTLTKILGPSYVVKASVGHVMDLPKSRLGIDLENGFAPEYILVKGKAPVKAELIAAGRNAKKIYLASDPDREGEAIAWHIAHLLGIDPASDCRVKFHEITADAVKSAVKEPSPIDLDLVNAQQARRILDRLVGYSLSPLLWKKIRRGLSAGRVQSAALSILCAREDEIEAFVPKDYWNVFVDASAADGRKYRLHLERENGKSLLTDGKTLAIDSEDMVKDIKATFKEEPLLVSSYSEKQSSRKPPAPFKTSTLQQMAASRLGLSPRRTMGIAQSLFEGVSIPGHGTVGLITYMRTDSLRMAPEALSQARRTIAAQWGEKFLPKKAIIYQAGENAQDAHEAIRPTNFAFTPDSIKDSLTSEQFRLYSMIWSRSVASQMSSAIVNLSTIECECGKYGLRAQGSSVAFIGWGAAWPLDVKDTMLDAATEGEALHADNIDAKKEQTKPPSRYTESSLIKTLEDDGIGRPSTYASIVETLYDRLYVERDDGRKLKPTKLGRTVNGFLLSHFDKSSASPIIDTGFTSSMENSLDRVERGEENWVELLSSFWKPFTEAISAAEKSEHLEASKPEPTGEVCPECGKPLVKRLGRYGEFIGCSGFPSCRYIKPVLKKIGVACPKCGAEHGGELVRRRSKNGRTFYGCSRYPDCDYVTWNKPKKEKS